MASLPDRITPGPPRQRLPAVVFAHLLPGELRIVVHPDEGQGGAEWDISIDLVPPDLRVPNTLIWVEVDPEFKVCRVMKRAQDEDYKINTKFFQRSVDGLSAGQACAGSVVPRKPFTLIAIIWLLALACVVFTRVRAHWPAYTSLHKWLSERGVPGEVRNLDSFLLFTLAAAIGAVAAYFWTVRGSERTGTSPAGLLGLRRGRPGWLPICLIALAPMVLGGAIIAATSGQSLPSAAEFWPRVYKGVIRAPVMEELFFRGLLVSVPAAAALGWSGRRFWINVVFAAALFASVHVEWTIDSALAGWPNLLVTFAGGMWYAWLLTRWRTLWVPMLLHSGMNLGWLLAGSAGGAGGGGLTENLLRVATITIATWLTIRATRSIS